MRVEIVTDSTSDLPQRITQERDIGVVPAVVSFGLTSYHDGRDIFQSKFLELLQDKSLPHPTTGAPSPLEYKTIYENHPNSNIVSVHVGSAFSKIFDTAVTTAQEMDPHRIAVLNSGTTSLALGFMAIQASLWAEAGLTQDKIIQRLELMKERTTMYASLKTLEYAERGGRISHLTALTGSMLSLKPILEISGNVLKSKDPFIRTRRKSLQRLVEIAQESPPLEMVGVVHAGAEKEAQDVANRISEFYTGTILMGEIGPALSAHAGPEAIGLALVRSEKEK